MDTRCSQCGEWFDANEGVCPICEETEYTLVQYWLQQWQEGIEEAEREIAENGIPF
jgi:hypothetical protein